jgi:hypothetical protein
MAPLFIPAEPVLSDAAGGVEGAGISGQEVTALLAETPAFAGVTA